MTVRLIDGEGCRLCHKCGEYWPNTAEFFFSNKKRNGFRSPCKACIAEKRQATNAVKPCCIPGCANPRIVSKYGGRHLSRCREHSRYREMKARGAT